MGGRRGGLRNYEYNGWGGGLVMGKEGVGKTRVGMMFVGSIMSGGLMQRGKWSK